jgi:hypothetical protein
MQFQFRCGAANANDCHWVVNRAQKSYIWNLSITERSVSEDCFDGFFAWGGLVFFEDGFFALGDLLLFEEGEETSISSVWSRLSMTSIEKAEASINTMKTTKIGANIPKPSRLICEANNSDMNMKFSVK